MTPTSVLSTDVHQLVSERQDEAFDKKLDLVFSVVYHECIESFPLWITNENRKYIHRSIEDVWEGEDKKALRHTTYIEFEMGDRAYKITQEFRMGHDEKDIHNYELWMNETLVFGVSESYRTVDGVTQYTTESVTAFVNEEWVEDFESIHTFYVEMLQEQTGVESVKTEHAHDLKKRFFPTKTTTKHPQSPVEKEKRARTYIQYNTLWIGIFVVILFLLLLTLLM